MAADPFAALNKACLKSFGTAVSYQQDTAAPFPVKGIVMKDSDEERHREGLYARLFVGSGRLRDASGPRGRGDHRRRDVHRLRSAGRRDGRRDALPARGGVRLLWRPSGSTRRRRRASTASASGRRRCSRSATSAWRRSRTVWRRRKGRPMDAAKPLSRYYAIRKTKMGKGNRRNLMLTGDMLRNFQVRTVSENKAKASNSTRKDRIKAWITQKIEPWVVFSPKNREVVHQTAQKLLAEIAPRLVIERSLGGKQHDRHLRSGRQSRRDAARHSRSGRGDGRRSGADLRVPRPVPEESQPRARDPPDARAVHHGGLAGHRAWHLRRLRCLEAFGHVVPPGARDVRRRPADSLLPDLPVDHQGRPDARAGRRC